MTFGPGFPGLDREAGKPTRLAGSLEDGSDQIEPASYWVLRPRHE
jgi:hypothetical protein